MRTTAIASDKVNCLSIRIDEVPGLESSMAFKIHAILSDKSLGIRNDRRYFFGGTSKQGNEISKVSFMHKYVHMFKCPALLGRLCRK